MKRKTTDDLSSDLIKSDNIDEYIDSNRPFFTEQDVPVLLAELYEKKSFTKADLARRSGMSVVYLHQVFSGRRKPSPGPAAVSLRRSGRHPGGDPAAAAAGVLRPALSKDQAGRHHQLWHRPSYEPDRDQR